MYPAESKKLYIKKKKKENQWPAIARREKSGKMPNGFHPVWGCRSSRGAVCNPILDFFARSMHAGKSNQASHLRLWQWASNGWYTAKRLDAHGPDGIGVVLKSAECWRRGTLRGLLTCQLVSGRPEIIIRKIVRRGRGRFGRSVGAGKFSLRRGPLANCTVRRSPLKSLPSGFWSTKMALEFGLQSHIRNAN